MRVFTASWTAETLTQMILQEPAISIYHHWEMLEDYLVELLARNFDLLPAKAFFALARLRHVQVEVGYHTIERQVWRYCHTLTIVKLPSSVVTKANAVFQGCYALTTVMMPGCLSLGARLFAECCALEQVGVLTGNSCRLVRGATISL